MEKSYEASEVKSNKPYGVLKDELKEFDKFSSEAIQGRGTITNVCTSLFTVICC